MRFHCGQTPESPFVHPATSRKQDFLHHLPVALKACLKTTTAEPHLGHVAHGILEVQFMEDIEDVVAVLPRRRLHQQFRHPLLLKMIPPSEPTGRFKCIFFQTVKTLCWVNYWMFPLTCPSCSYVLFVQIYLLWQQACDQTPTQGQVR